MIKQVIVVRKDLKMRRGKEIAQGAHASIAFLTRRLQNKSKYSELCLTRQELDWINGIFTKVCLKVNSEEELLEVERKAKEAGLECHLVTDAGLTEFNGVPTKTCLAIGPDESEKIDLITGDLELY
jgi:PTH2 family peptidyl-tRNA hydrolase